MPIHDPNAWYKARSVPARRLAAAVPRTVGWVYEWIWREVGSTTPPAATRSSASTGRTASGPMSAHARGGGSGGGGGGGNTTPMGGGRVVVASPGVTKIKLHAILARKRWAEVEVIVRAEWPRLAVPLFGGDIATHVEQLVLTLGRERAPDLEAGHRIDALEVAAPGNHRRAADALEQRGLLVAGAPLVRKATGIPRSLNSSRRTARAEADGAGPATHGDDGAGSAGTGDGNGGVDAEDADVERMTWLSKFSIVDATSWYAAPGHATAFKEPPHSPNKHLRWVTETEVDQESCAESGRGLGRDGLPSIRVDPGLSQLTIGLRLDVGPAVELFGMPILSVRHPLLVMDTRDRYFR